MLVEVKIGALIMDPNSNTPIVVLKSLESDLILPIWVGAFEANAIALEIEKIVPQRPMTHDLLKNLINVFGFRLEKVVVSDLRDNTFYAVIEFLNDQSQKVQIDARPSDAVALALRFDCPIFVDQKVFELSAASTVSIEDPPEEADAPEDWPDFIG